MTTDLVVFLQAVAATAASVNAVFFYRFWRDRRDPLFAFFGGAFSLLSLSWVLLSLAHPTEEARPYIYGLRLLAFVLIVAAIIQKNRAAGR